MNMLKRIFTSSLPALVLSLLTMGCASTAPILARPAPLRVGLTPDLPPLVYREAGELRGLEVDLARQLAVALGRPVEVSSMPWDRLLKSLQAGQIDVIMGGISITPARALQVAFTEPILGSGLIGLVRSADRESLATRAQLAAYGGQIGVLPGTTGDTYVQRAFPRARRIPVASAPDAVVALQRRGIDAFVYDLPTLVWLHSKNEAGTALMAEVLQREPLGWAVRPGDAALLADINRVLDGWKKDGTLAAEIKRWLPYYERALGIQPAP